MKTPERTQYDWHITACFHMITWLRRRPRHSGLGTGGTFTFALSGKWTSHGVCEKIHCFIKHDLYDSSDACETKPHIIMHKSATVSWQNKCQNKNRKSLAPWNVHITLSEQQRAAQQGKDRFGGWYTLDLNWKPPTQHHGASINIWNQNRSKQAWNLVD